VPASAYIGGERRGPRVALFLDDVVRVGLPEVFPQYDVGEAFAVKLSRDADLYVDDEYSGDLVEKIRAGLARRSLGVPSRFLYDPRTPYGTVTLLKRRLKLDDEDIVGGGAYHNLSDLFALTRPDDPALSYPPMPPIGHPELEAAPSILDAVRERDRIIHLPYQDYEPVLRFLDEAAADPAVEDLSATLYRVAKDSRVVDALCRAAEAGKRVTAFVEVKARFDEEQNLENAERMTAAGVRVHYSMPAIKVHAKMLLAGRREGDRLVDYAALATGNFNEKTSRIYADHVLLTADERLTADVREVFRFLSGEIEAPDTRHLLVAPFTLRSSLFALVDREIDRARGGDPGALILKMNSLEDEEAVEKLYDAAGAGVDIEMIVRGICRLVPGVAGWSESIRVRSIVDRYLEHARIFLFHDGGADYLYLASADWMRRNLRRRVEVAFPLYDPEVREEVLALLEMQLDDDSRARVIDAEQSNAYVEPRGNRRAQVDAYDYLALRAGVAAAQRHTSPAARPETIASQTGDGWALRPAG
jgi:polyphosphate kinase